MFIQIEPTFFDGCALNYVLGNPIRNVDLSLSIYC